MNGPSPRAAYVHVPFCSHHCAYCNFTVVAGRSDLETAYLDALECELNQLAQPRPVETLFVGGGTPTELSPQGLRRLCRLLTSWFPWDARGEASCEANPETLDRQRIEILAEAGFHRVSLGMQSFDDAKLIALDRRHCRRDIERALELVSQQIPRVSVDLIFAAPGETAVPPPSPT